MIAAEIKKAIAPAKLLNGLFLNINSKLNRGLHDTD